MKSNAQKIADKLSGTEFVVGGINDKIERLNDSNLKKVLENLTYGSCDVDVFVNRKPFVVEISHVDNEVDVGILSKAEYINRYGSERYESD